MSEQAALDKKAIRKEILALIIPIILESIFVYLAGIVSASLVGVKLVLREHRQYFFDGRRLRLG